MNQFYCITKYFYNFSLRVNLDVGKAFYSWVIQRDQEMPGTVVRTTTIPEELGRINYLLTDKTGTLTQNEMVFKILHLGTVAYGTDTFDEVIFILYFDQFNIHEYNPSNIICCQMYYI